MNEARKAMTVAVVDDDANLRRLLRRALEDAGYKVLEGDDGTRAVELADTQSIDAMVLDVRMPEMTGLEALDVIMDRKPEIAVLLLTAFIDVRDAVDALKKGAKDYLEKPIDLDELVIAVDEALGVARDGLPSAGGEVDLPSGVIAESEAMKSVFREADRVAPTDATVLIQGESGTGKEVLANLIHERSGRKGAFVAVNCAALPESLIESELFGHEKGAFTGAVASKPGRFEEAQGGTLFLDEIGEMPLALQPKLLRVLEDHRVRRVGGQRDITVDARIVTATNRLLQDDAREGRFREDLLYRLNVFALDIPPLRLRRDDIMPMAERFLESEHGRGKRVSPAAQRVLFEHDWSGNARELRNAVARAAIMAHGSLILPEDLPESVRTPGTSTAEKGSVLVGDMEAIQKQAILEAIEKTGGNKTHAAELLGISRRNLIYKLRSYGL